LVRHCESRQPTNQMLTTAADRLSSVMKCSQQLPEQLETQKGDIAGKD